MEISLEIQGFLRRARYRGNERIGNIGIAPDELREQGLLVLEVCVDMLIGDPRMGGIFIHARAQVAIRQEESPRCLPYDPAVFQPCRLPSSHSPLCRSHSAIIWRVIG